MATWSGWMGSSPVVLRIKRRFRDQRGLTATQVPTPTSLWRRVRIPCARGLLVRALSLGIRTFVATHGVASDSRRARRHGGAWTTDRGGWRVLVVRMRMLRRQHLPWPWRNIGPIVRVIALVIRRDNVDIFCIPPPGWWIANVRTVVRSWVAVGALVFKGTRGAVVGNWVRARRTILLRRRR